MMFPKKVGPNVPAALDMQRCRFKCEILAVQSRHMGSVDILRVRAAPPRRRDARRSAALPAYAYTPQSSFPEAVPGGKMTYSRADT
jgi:hypothetical protein